MCRHLELEERLAEGRGGISRETALLFPKEKAGEILQWYTRLVAGLSVLLQEQERFKRSTAVMAGFLENYPGPEPQPVRRTTSKEAWRDVLQSRLLGEDASSHYSGQVEEAELRQREFAGSRASEERARGQFEGTAQAYSRSGAPRRSERSLQEDFDQTLDLAGAAGTSYRVGGATLGAGRGFVEEDLTQGRVNQLREDLVKPKGERRSSSVKGTGEYGVSPENLDTSVRKRREGAWDAGLEGGSLAKRQNSIRSREEGERSMQSDRERQQFYADEYHRGGRDREEDWEDRRSVTSSRSSKVQGLKSMSRPAMIGVEDEREEWVEVDGFESLSNQQIEASIRVMVVQKLKEQGVDSEIARNIICDQWPMFNLHPRKGKVEDVRYFDKCAKLIKPTSKGEFIAMDDWFEAMKDQGDIQGWSIRQRIKWLKTTGGLANKVNDAIQSRVKDKLRTILTWIPDYDPAHPSTNNNYWFQVWADVMVMLIKEFFTTQHADQMEDAYLAGLGEKKFAIDESQSDPLNKEWYKFAGSWEAQWTMLRKRGSEYLSSPLYVWNLFKKWWEKQGKRGAGKMMVDIVERALNKLSTSPLSVFPAYHGLDSEELEEVRRKGKGGASMVTYSLIMEFYKRKAGLGELTMVFTDFKMMDAMTRGEGGEYEKGKTDKKRERKANAALKGRGGSDVSTLTVNTAVSSSKTPVACSLCGLYHTYLPVCPLVKDGKMSVEAVINYRSLREISADGKSSFNPFWRKKFRIFVLPKLGIISAEDQEKWFKKVDDALAKKPTAPAEAIKRYQQENSKFVNLCREEESRDGGYVSRIVAKDRSDRKQSRKALMARVDEDEESSDSETDLDNSDSSDGSV